MSDSPPPSFPVVRSNVALRAPIDWLRAGWADLRAHPAASLFYGLCFAVIGWIFVLAFRHAVQLVTAVTAGFILAGPFLCIGLYALSRQRERGEVLRIGPTLTAWRSKGSTIGIYSGILIILYLIWARASMVVFALFYSGGMPSIDGFIAEVSNFDNLDFLLAYMSVGGFFVVLVFAISVISIPLMLERDQDAVTAIIASVLALTLNPAPVLFWGALIVALIGIGIGTAFIGLIVTGPWVGHASWHAFRAIIEPCPTIADSTQ
jgi:uncharacterized membrane protein